MVTRKSKVATKNLGMRPKAVPIVSTILTVLRTTLPRKAERPAQSYATVSTFLSTWPPQSMSPSLVARQS